MALTEAEKETLKKFAHVKVKVRELNGELEDLKPSVQAILTDIHAEDTPVETEDGVLSLRPRRVWTYSEELEAQMKQIKQQQVMEEATGRASFETRYDVYFK
jgi:hypothetical protein